MVSKQTNGCRCSNHCCFNTFISSSTVTTPFYDLSIIWKTSSISSGVILKLSLKFMRCQNQALFKPACMSSSPSCSNFSGVIRLFFINWTRIFTFLNPLALASWCFGGDGMRFSTISVSSYLEISPFLSLSNSPNTFSIQLLEYLGAISVINLKNSQNQMRPLPFLSIFWKSSIGFSFLALSMAIISSIFLESTSSCSLKSTQKSFALMSAQLSHPVLPVSRYANKVEISCEVMVRSISLTIATKVASLILSFLYLLIIALKSVDIFATLFWIFSRIFLVQSPTMMLRTYCPG